MQILYDVLYPLQLGVDDEGVEDPLQDILHLPGDLLDNDLVDTIMNEEADIKVEDGLEDIASEDSFASLYTMIVL